MEEVHVVDVCNHKTRHDGFVLLPNCCELRRGSKFLAKTEEVHDVADPKMRSAESQEVKRLASEYAKSKKLSEFGSCRCWFPYQLTSAGFGQRSVDFWGDDLLLYFKVSEGEQESWPMKISFKVISGAPYAHWTLMDFCPSQTFWVFVSHIITSPSSSKMPLFLRNSWYWGANGGIMYKFYFPRSASV